MRDPLPAVELQLDLQELVIGVDHDLGGMGVGGGHASGAAAEEWEGEEEWEMEEWGNEDDWYEYYEYAR